MLAPKMPNTWDKGDKVTLQITFKNKAGALANPSTVTIKLRDPDGVVTTKTSPDVSNPSTGVFEYDHVFSKAGIWHYRWISTGDPALEEETYASVRTPVVV